MLLDSNDVLIVVASLKWAAMEHDKHSKAMALRDPVKAAHAAKFSQECARIAAEFEKRGRVAGSPRLNG